jgi:hypothetical protein
MHHDMTRAETDAWCQANRLTSSSAALPVKCGRSVKPWPMPRYRSTRAGKGFFAMACAEHTPAYQQTQAGVCCASELVIMYVRWNARQYIQNWPPSNSDMPWAGSRLVWTMQLLSIRNSAGRSPAC